MEQCGTVNAVQQLIYLRLRGVFGSTQSEKKIVNNECSLLPFLLASYFYSATVIQDRNMFEISRAMRKLAECQCSGKKTETG